MRSGPLELQPAREFVQRMHELETELQRARQAQRRLKADPDAPSRWGLETRSPAQQEEGWFLTYLDMMTLLLVAMIVMLAFSGGVMRRDPDAAAKPVLHSQPTTRDTDETGAAAPLPAAPAAAGATAADHASGIPAPDDAFPYPAAPAGAFEQSAYPSQAVAAMASAYPTPADLTPKPPAEPAPAPVAAAPQSDAATPSPATPGAAPAPAAATPPVPAETPAAAATSHPAPTTAAPGSAVEPTPTPPVSARPAPGASPASEPAAVAAALQPPAPAEPAANAQSEGQSLAAALPLDDLGSEVEVIVNKRSVSLRINSEILFGTGQADLSAHGLAVLKRMARVLSKGGYDITVEGHTDSVPVRNNGRYPSNWELSSARAGSVVRYFQANGIGKAHLKAVGYADTRPLADNQDADGRARNRRVELLIEKPEPDAARPQDRSAPAADARPAAPGR
ncbi:OmpA family protein [Castellaniella sp.]|uniref:OmpA family protein n=1 Tax=Castellaniella sp. TaxID=1955812 RepID=UPI002AFEF644|nr:OmpA family protein [Castellaniella sp.]